MEFGKTGVNGQNVQYHVMVVYKFGRECAHLLSTMANGVKVIALRIRPAIVKDVLV